MPELYAFDHELRESEQSGDVHKQGSLVLTLDLRVEPEEWNASTVYAPSSGIIQRVVRVDLRRDQQALWELARSTLEQHYGVIDIMSLNISLRAKDYDKEGMPRAFGSFSVMVRDGLGAGESPANQRALCPNCGGDDLRTEERLLGSCRIAPTRVAIGGSGESDFDPGFDGETDVWWDSSETQAITCGDCDWRSSEGAAYAELRWVTA